jgi:hypothetical protein
LALTSNSYSNPPQLQQQHQISVEEKETWPLYDDILFYAQCERVIHSPSHFSAALHGLMWNNCEWKWNVRALPRVDFESTFIYNYLTYQTSGLEFQFVTNEEQHTKYKSGCYLHISSLTFKLKLRSRTFVCIIISYCIIILFVFYSCWLSMGGC